MLYKMWKWLAPAQHREREVVRVPSPEMREIKNQRDNLYECLRLVDGLLSGGEVKAAHSQVRLTITALGKLKVEATQRGAP